MNEAEYRKYIIELLEKVHSKVSLKRILDLILYLINKE